MMTAHRSLRERQQLCEDWYDALSTDSRRALFSKDYKPHQAALRTFYGSVLDVGAGCGFAAHYLPRSASYIALEPSTFWLHSDWLALANKRDFVLGIGEELPFASSTFDGFFRCGVSTMATRPSRYARRWPEC